MHEIEMKAHYLSQPYFWKQQSYVERPFGKFREKEQNVQNKTSLTRTSTYNQHNAVVLLRY